MTAPLSLPVDRPAGCPFHQPELPERSVTRVGFPSTDEGWLVTKPADIRAVLSDPRFSAASRRLLFSKGQPQNLPLRPGAFIGMDAPEHPAYRKLLTSVFTVKRMQALKPRVQEIVDERLAAMAALGGEADLVAEFALPVPSLVICQLLGVPYEDRDEFQSITGDLLRLDTTLERRDAALAKIDGYLGALVAAKRREPDEALLSRLVQQADAGVELLTDEVLVGFATLLLVAGHETTANQIALSTALLLQHPDQLALLRDRPELAPRATEELLRYLTIVQHGLQRTAVEDVEVGGTLVKAGEYVSLHLGVANTDPSLLADGERLDLTRPPSPHLAFGYGPHQCLGQQLARIEIQLALTSLFQRFPGLALAAPLHEIPFRTEMAVYGVHRLPVRW
ncbi:cytochrome P450 [Crossiella equi]|uniref:Cytochrome P450 n=1 Tax=Crossiella equi TaxID=130796 RepID=A0ABS5AJ93_9PSEU|nr:cytochrome P450 [Crossiella equi]MBP2476639.1 cytochrome P450 [Crossiella equi]